MTQFGLSYPIYSGNARSLKKTLFKNVRQNIKKISPVGGEVVMENNVAVVRALHDITFTIHAGERVGLVGHNGAGKSTLLRAIAGIFESSQGDLHIMGDVHSLLDAGAGMNPDLTGRENIRLYAASLGYTRQASQLLEQDVESFAELGAFLDMPVRLYSAGMGVRLGFALATAPRPDILLMDEWFMAGDQGFHERAEQRLHSLVDHADILVLTSHELHVLRKWCTRIIWLEHGRMRMDGPAKDVLDAYEAAASDGS
ncbi:ABC transporter ATP-binding protein [Candidatus Kirkpatrickella diaphorinae]